MKMIFSNDQYKMDWFREDFEYAQVLCKKPLDVEVEHERQGDRLRTRIVFTNHTAKPIFTSVDSIGIRFPLNDRYEEAKVCITSRCHTHVFCGGNVSYICALRMGGEAPHLGMVLTEGSLDSYSIERDIRQISNDRGCFILHPSPTHLAPGEHFALEWLIFSHEGKVDFDQKLAEYNRFVSVMADRFVMYEGEQNLIHITPAFKADCVMVNGEEVKMVNDAYVMAYTADVCGEKRFDIVVDGIATSLTLLVIPEIERLARTRCHFIAQKQQYHVKAGSGCTSLDGAYLAYDNEEGHIYYDVNNDYNGARERVGMGLAIAKYLQHHTDAVLEDSLRGYVDYVIREIVDVETGMVCNDIGYDDSFKRAYNYPWFAEFFVELYCLYHKPEYLVYAVRMIKHFYSQDGLTHYSIELPVLGLCHSLLEAGMERELEEVRGLFVMHANHIAERDINYPPFEVKFEQSIVAPAANILLQTYILTKDEKYLEAGRRHMAVLELFNGKQPDYHLYETAVRHWDGYWFGKRKLYGDTFHHYWSGLTGNVFLLYAYSTGDTAYIKRAEDSLRGVLSLINEDGSGSCAYVYPYSINGVKANFQDPLANDQDWALYFMLRYRWDFSRFFSH